MLKVAESVSSKSLAWFHRLRPAEWLNLARNCAAVEQGLRSTAGLKGLWIVDEGPVRCLRERRSLRKQLDAMLTERNVAAVETFHCDPDESPVQTAERFSGLPIMQDVPTRPLRTETRHLGKAS